MAVQYNPGIVTDGLALYLDASNPKSYRGSGTAWYDISGNGKNFAWVKSPSFTRAIGTSYFSTLNNCCKGPASNSFGITNTSGYTIFISCLENSQKGAGAFEFYKDGVSENARRGIFLHLTYSGYIYWDQGGCCNTDTRTSDNVQYTTSSWNIYCFVKNSTNRRVLRNNKVLMTNGVTAANIDLNGNAVDLGSTEGFGGNTAIWDARLSTFLVYNRGLDDNEMTQNYYALRGRFGV